MRINKSIVIRYSQAFKQQVVKDVEEGFLSCEQARRKYGIKGDGTVQTWLKRMGKLKALPTVIRLENPNEKDRIKELERQIRQLKNSLADTQVRYLLAESQFEIVCEQQGLDPEEVKKKLQEKNSSEQ
jgi:transposase-like protein